MVADDTTRNDYFRMDDGVILCFSRGQGREEWREAAVRIREFKEWTNQQQQQQQRQQ